MLLRIPLLRNNEHEREIYRGKRPMITQSFLVATEYLSCSLLGSLSHAKSSPIAASQMVLYTW